MRISIRLCQIFSLPILFFGCMVGPRYEPPEEDVPCDWHSMSPQDPSLDCEALDCFVWWESLQDPLLTSLIERAAEQNLDLYIAATRILEARAERKGKCADYLPRIDGSTACGHALINDLLIDALPPNQDSIKRNLDFFEIGFDAEWEIDLFGITAHEVKALEAKVESAEESLCDVWVTLSAEVARNYIELRGWQLRLTSIETNIEAQQEMIQLNRELLQIGMKDAIEVRQSEEFLSGLLARKPLIQLSIDKAIHRLSILLGYSPGDLFEELSGFCALPCLPCDKPIGIPSELLRRRPDIRRAERELAAATERIGVAVASLFPRLSLRGFIGDISTQLKTLTCPSSGTWIAGPQLLMPIFNSKLILQDIDYNKIKTRQALYQYQKTVLEALEETENAIASFHYELERNLHLAEAFKANQDVYALTDDLYQRGLKDYLEVQLIKRSLLEAEDAYTQSQVDLLSHFISLYKALGGSW